MGEQHKTDLEEAHALHRAHDLDAAKEKYLTLLKKEPHNADILHALGIIATQQQNYSEAIESLESAAQHQPNDPSIPLHLANVYKLQGLYTKALALLQETQPHHPTYLPLLNNLGTVYYHLGKLEEAIQTFQAVIDKEPHYIDAYYNLGLSFSKKNQLKEAIGTYQTLLRLDPNHFASRFHLANQLMNDGQLKSAIKHFEMIATNHPHHLETQTNLATCYLKEGHWSSAYTHYLNALKLSPDDTQLLFNLGIVTTHLGQLDQAIHYYQRIIQFNPDHFPAHNNLGVLFLSLQQISAAQLHFQTALRIQPTHVVTQHILKMLSNHSSTEQSPPEYITTLFDAYADHYESHLVNTLHQRTPQVLYDILHAVMPLPKKEWSILDLGCGTGLCGALFKPCAKKLTGVDLSSKMLEIAYAKGIYDELIQQAIIPYLKNTATVFDLILASDVLIYSGDLEELFECAKKALAASGLFIFNTEISDNENYKLNANGRFSHSIHYLENLIKEHSFRVLSYQKAMLREENKQKILGHVFVLQKR